MKYILFDESVNQPVIRVTEAGKVGALGAGPPLVFDSISDVITCLRTYPGVLRSEQNRLTIRRATETTTVTYEEEVS